MAPGGATLHQHWKRSSPWSGLAAEDLEGVPERTDRPAPRGLEHQERSGGQRQSQAARSESTDEVHARDLVEGHGGGQGTGVPDPSRRPPEQHPALTQTEDEDTSGHRKGGSTAATVGDRHTRGDQQLFAVLEVGPELGRVEIGPPIHVGAR